MKIQNFVFSVLVFGLIFGGFNDFGAAQNLTGKAKNKAKNKSTAQLLFEAQARADGKDTVFYIKGFAYSYIPGERPQKLFNVEGYNIRKYIETPEKDGFFMATREIVFYKDPRTDEILSDWENPWTKEKVEVFHIQNDPVNFRIRIKDGKYIGATVNGKTEFGERTVTEDWNDTLITHNDAFPFYPLPGFEKNYTAAELFDFYTPKEDLKSKKAPRTLISWTRVGPWLPWMKMPNNGGVIIIHARSVRYENFEDLPTPLKQTVREKYPLYLTAPDKVDINVPNETSWTFYLKEMKKRGQ